MKITKIIFNFLILLFGILLVACNGAQTIEIETTEAEETTVYDETTEETTEEEMETINFSDYVDFVVSVPEDREPIVLQLTDPQIIDSSQCRTEDRLSSIGKDIWSPDKKDIRCYDYLREIIENTNPDLIILTGDIVYGEFDDNGENLLEIIEFFESFGIPWAPVFGNHDNESKMGVDWQCEQFENAEHCLFLQRDLTGNGNYTVGIEQGGKLTRVFFMLDSNGCANASQESLANGHTKTSPGFGKDQIKWYKEVVGNIHDVSPDTKYSMAFHIQISMFGEAFKKYNTDGTDHIFIDYYEDKQEGDFGYIGSAMKGPWDGDLTVWKTILRYGFDSVFVGHEHANSASIVYNGVRLQYGMKTSTYDRSNYIDKYGNIVVSDNSSNTPWIGGSVFNLASDGSIVNPHIYYCENAGGNIDWNDVLKPEAAVNGLQKGKDLTVQMGVSITGVYFDDDTTAYEVISNSQGKLYVNVGLLKNKSTFTFTVYLPETSNQKLGGMGEFAIRVKPNEIEPSKADGQVDGYIDYDSASSLESCQLKYGEWQTFTVDISSLGEDCTEFAFVIPAGNTIYLKDLTIE
ncbi:MAG: metallophosphoesterase [Clostridia bacterium]|nr:metallophosphoesterase [Clostridia bacterium]